MAKEDERGQAAAGLVNQPEYLQALQAAADSTRGLASLDRSEMFRHKADYEIFASALKETKEAQRPLKILVIGVGNMEEPVSFLAAAHSELKPGHINETVDMELVDVRSIEDVNDQFRLGKQLFAPDKPIEPKLYKDSFTLVEGGYEPKEEIKDYLLNLMQDESKAHFSTPIENFTRTNGGQYDVVACNNVIQHLGGIEGYPSPYKNPREQNYPRYCEEISKILDLVKAGGIIFIHAPAPGNRFDTKGKGVTVILSQVSGFDEKFTEIRPGVYQKKGARGDKP